MDACVYAKLVHHVVVLLGHYEVLNELPMCM